MQKKTRALVVAATMTGGLALGAASPASAATLVVGQVDWNAACQNQFSPTDPHSKVFRAFISAERISCGGWQNTTPWLAPDWPTACGLQYTGSRPQMGWADPTYVQLLCVRDVA
jgi:hypothetical protein